MPHKNWLPTQTDGEVVPLDSLENRAVKSGIVYWERLRGDRLFPVRDEIVLRQIGPSLKHAVLVKVLDGGVDYQYRVVGDAIVQGFCENFGGKLLSTVIANAPKFGQPLRRLYETARCTGNGLGFRLWTGQDLFGAEFSYFESAILPFGSDGTVDHLLIFSSTLTLFESPPARRSLDNYTAFPGQDRCCSHS